MEKKNNINDIENQFCAIDDFENMDNSINYCDIELINLISNNSNFDSDSNHKSYFIKNKLKKSKSFPNTVNNISTIKKIHNYNNYDNNNITCNLSCITESNQIENKINYKKKSIWIFLIKICDIIYCEIKKIDKIEIINKFLTICLHIFIMIIFEIYFYFNYVVWIEKEEFVNQINKYIGRLDYLPINSIEKEIIKYVIKSNQNKYQDYLDFLYIQYKNSLDTQKKILEELLVKACNMAGIVGIIFLSLLVIGLYNRKNIKWNWIWIENFFMFLFLGIFEYFFFMTIILNFNPITEAEVKYLVASGIINYFNSTV